MSFVFSHVVSMRYFLLAYLRRGICLANSIVVRDPGHLVLLGISKGTRTES
jgi:hypothetical protein